MKSSYRRERGLRRYLAGAATARAGDEMSGPALLLLGFAVTGLATGSGLLASRPLLRATVTSVVSYVGIGMLLVCCPVLGAQRLGGPARGALLISAIAVASLIANTILARRPGRGQPDVWVLASTLVIGVSMAAAAAAPGWLTLAAIGLDPARTVMFAHSAVPALNQLLLPLLSLVSVPELNRNPTVKDEIAHSRQSAVSGLMLAYPVHQAADILFGKANLVPVGQDQLPHLEIARVIARRFNDRFGRPVFPVPDALLSAAPLLLGTDGTKMSKSRGNAVPLSATADETARLVRGAQTDSERHISYDPVRRPAVSSLVLLVALCLGRDPREVAADIGDGGAAMLKNIVATAVNDLLAPVRSRRAEYARDLGYVRQVLREGNERANEIASATLTEVREAMGMGY